MFEVSTLGQPFEVIKTQLAANRGQSLAEALKTIYSRGGVFGFYQGLIPWAWIEAASKGAVLLFTASEFEYRSRAAGASPFMVSNIIGFYCWKWAFIMDTYTCHCAHSNFPSPCTFLFRPLF